MESRIRVALLFLVLLTQGPGWASAESIPATNAPTVQWPGTNGVALNFHAAQVDQVLDYLSAAAHWVIHKEAAVRGTVDLQSATPLDLDGVVELLNSALKKLGCVVSLNGRILTVANLESAKTSDLDVVSGVDPDKVEKSDRVVTQIIPVRYATASQLVNNLQLLLPTSATLSVNESANTLILVATKTQIRRMLKIISAIDISMARVTAVRVVPLRYADAKQLATVLQQLFSSSQGPSANGSFNAFGGFAPPGAGGGPGGQTTSGASSDSTSASKVTAVADEQSNSLIVSASADYLPIILKMVKDIDRPVTDVTELRLFTLHNADPSELAEELAQIFGASVQNSDQAQAMPQFNGGSPGAGGGPPGFGGGPGFGGPGGPTGVSAGSADSSASSRSLKKAQVLAVADSRTSSLLVSAASTMMQQISTVIEELDANAARKEFVQVYDLHNADPQDVNQILQDLFNRNSSGRNNNASDRTSLLGQGNPLTSRATEQNGTSTQSSGSANSTGRSGTGGQGASGTGGF